MIHTLKTWPEYFQEVYLNRKTFEVRKNDRNFKSHDVLVLMEYKPDAQQFTGLYVLREVGYMLHGGEFGLPADICVMSLREMYCRNCHCSEHCYSPITGNVSCANCGNVIDE